MRWNFVFQRPQHLLIRFAAERRVFFFEEPFFDSHDPRLDVRMVDGVHVAVPHLPEQTDDARTTAIQRTLVERLLTDYQIADPIAWYYNPMALDFTRDLPTRAVVFDCMDELSGFAGAPPRLAALENELLSRACIVFTGGHSLYAAKRSKHPRVHAFPSSVDREHFEQGRVQQREPEDQSGIPRPRIGFFGVIDERMDLDLIAGVARLRPEWHFVLIGPTAKIDPATLPAAANIHFLGMKSYKALPSYLAGWDVAMMPFARNDATRFISPTKTPEYLAAGLPVVSTSIADVVRPYGERGLVQIADTPEAFVRAIDAARAGRTSDWRSRVDDFLAGLSWDHTWADMKRLMEDATTRSSKNAVLLGSSHA